MTAVACLRIVVGADQKVASASSLAALVAKVAGAYLDARWCWPRRHGLIAPFAFVLADPRATKLDPRELQAMAADLQKKLFGSKGAGDVCLVMFEGDQTEIMRFASAHARDLQALLDGDEDATLSCRVCKITPTEVTSIVPKGGSVTGAPPMEDLTALDNERVAPETVWDPIYQLARERFVGGGVIWREDTDIHASLALVEGEEATRRDLLCLEAAIEAMRKGPKGYLFLPFSFSSMIKPSARGLYLPLIERLPRGMRHRMAATVYGVPREPSFGALSKIREFLNPSFSLLDLHVADPAFRIETVPADIATSVTLSLAGSDGRARRAAISRFLAERDAYRQRKVLQGVAGIRDAKELDLCRLLNAPFLSGPAVAGLSEEPPGEFDCQVLDLPYDARGDRPPRPMPFGR